MRSATTLKHSPNIHIKMDNVTVAIQYSIISIKVGQYRRSNNQTKLLQITILSRNLVRVTQMIRDVYLTAMLCFMKETDTYTSREKSKRRV